MKSSQPSLKPQSKKLDALYKLVERTGSTVEKMEKIVGQIREIQEGKS